MRNKGSLLHYLYMNPICLFLHFGVRIIGLHNYDALTKLLTLCIY